MTVLNYAIVTTEKVNPKDFASDSRENEYSKTFPDLILIRSSSAYLVWIS